MKMRRWAEYFQDTKDFLSNIWSKIDAWAYAYPWMSRGLLIATLFGLSVWLKIGSKNTPVGTTFIVVMILLFMIWDVKAWAQNWVESFNKRLGKVEKAHAKKGLFHVHNGLVFVGDGLTIRPEKVNAIEVEDLSIRIYFSDGNWHLHKCNNKKELEETARGIRRACNYRLPSTGEPMFQVLFEDSDSSQD